MDIEKYLIFAENLTSIDVDNVNTSVSPAVQTTTSLVNPIDSAHFIKSDLPSSDRTPSAISTKNL